MRILVENSTWNNIGDGFYQYSLYHLLHSAFPDATISMMDGPIRRAFKPGRFADRAFHLNHYQQADLYVFSGPILGARFFDEYSPIIERILSEGSRYCILSAHGESASAGPIREYLQGHPPVAFSSRDRPTFERYSNVCDHILDGVCTAALVSRTCPVADMPPTFRYIASSFYQVREPSYSINHDEIVVGTGGKTNIERHNSWRWTRHLEWLTPTQELVGDYLIVRPVHDIAYKFPHLNFPRKNCFLSYNPLSYLSVYKHACLTVTNRVHAALPALSFGKPAIYFGSTERNAIFDRLGMSNYVGHKCSLDDHVIELEHKQMLDFVRSIPT